MHGSSEHPAAAKITLVDKETDKVSGLYHSNGNTGSFIIIVNPFCEYKLIAEYKDFKPVEIDLPSVVKQPVNLTEDEVLKIIFNQ